jgi:hypothetical protein
MNVINSRGHMKKLFYLLVVAGLGVSASASFANQPTPFMKPIEGDGWRIVFLHKLPACMMSAGVKKGFGSDLLEVKIDTKNGTAKLYPNGVKSGLIDLRKLRPRELESGWGFGQKTKDGESFNLIVDSQTSEIDLFHLDTKIVDGKLTAFRLRGIGISNPQWETSENWGSSDAAAPKK